MPQAAAFDLVQSLLPEAEKPASVSSIRVSELISALSYALDLTEGRPMGHSVRSCLIGMRIGEELHLGPGPQADLYYTLLLKDAGCSSNSSRLYHILNADDIRAKGDLKTTDWTKVGWESLHYAITHVATSMPFPERVWRLIQVAATQQRDSCELVKIRCERGSSIARKLGFSEAVATGIHSLDEHWNGRGYPDGQLKRQIPLASNLANLAQTLEVFWAARGPQAAIEAAEARSGRWFDPQLVKAAVSLAKRSTLWSELASDDLLPKVMAQEPEDRRLTATESTIDSICLAFAEIIDAKTPFTYQHSNGVADAAVLIAKGLGVDHQGVKRLQRAALLHDIGKLGVSNAILEKPGKLTGEEFTQVRKHPYYTYEILKRIPAFADFGIDAASHHERLDGKGYWRGLTGDQMPLPSRILAVADVFDALKAKRPYRDALPLEKVFSIMQEDTPHALDWPCLAALMESKRAVGDSVAAEPAAVAV
jgi:HD-GYP domain-containing protein (c-di-GMP phosphodiesterase class II)